jgi:hypothetical protein
MKVLIDPKDNNDVYIMECLDCKSVLSCELDEVTFVYTNVLGNDYYSFVCCNCNKMITEKTINGNSPVRIKRWMLFLVLNMK